MTDVVVRSAVPHNDLRGGSVHAYEEEPHAGDWLLEALVICATAN